MCQGSLVTDFLIRVGLRDARDHGEDCGEGACARDGRVQGQDLGKGACARDKRVEDRSPSGRAGAGSDEGGSGMIRFGRS